MAQRHPNILILMPDQQRADCMGCAGHPQIRTPHMDRLTAEGMRFTHACTVSPLCMPARASFLSGLYVHNHDMWTNAGELFPEEESLFRRLGQHGYYTAHIGKSHYYEHGGFHLRVREPYMHARGFDAVHETTGPWATCRTDSYMTDLWRERGFLKAFRDDYEKRRRHPGIAVWPSPLPVELFLDSYIGAQAVRFLDEYERDEPFALFVGFGGPHEPWDAPGEYATMYDPGATPPRIEPCEPGPWVPEAAAAWQRSGRPAAMTEDDVRRLRANYYGKISLVDRWFGEILAACERKGALDDLLVAHWSDHGEMAGDHGLLHKSRFLESALRVPLTLRWPGRVPAGQTSAALAETVDLMPTILEAVGAEAPGSCLGKSLWPVVGDPAARVRDAAFSEIAHHGRRNVMVRTERHKYAVHEDGAGYLLYDLAEDPQERRNLIGHPAARGVEAALRERLLRFLCESQRVL
ncbi:MAG TPA: sulfatase-like hydrolase/transferase [Planctomycetota bacterium]|nr:sulfatase-like hydrolase/transferase [Planctomycetota bacterium]